MSTLQTCTSGSRPSHGAGVIAYETNTTRTIISDGSSWHLYMPSLFSRANCAFSFRQIVPDYTGKCVKVRRSSDNGEVDIGFTSAGVLNQAALLSHTGTDPSSAGYAVTWYDQGPHSMDATQATAANQPAIVLSGAVVVSNSKPSLQFGGSYILYMPEWATYRPDTQCWLSTAGAPTAGVVVCELTSVGGGTNQMAIWGTGANANGYSNTYGDNIGIYGTSGAAHFHRTQAQGGALQLSDTAALSNTTQAIGWWNYDGTTMGISTNGGSEQTTTATPNPWAYTKQTIGAGQVHSADEFTGKISELISYKVSRASEKTAILANVNGFYETY
jgi:hypothetical protein